MTVFTEGRHPGEILMSEANGFRSRGQAVIKAGSGVFEPGTVVGALAAGNASSAAKAGGANTGNGVLTLDATTPVLTGAKAGVYTVRCVAAAANGGTFRVEDPEGNVIGDVAVGATFADDIKFVIADGAADFVLGDGFDITVVLGTPKFAPSPSTSLVGIEGAEVAAAVTLYGGDATTEDVEVTVIVRDAEINLSRTSFHTSVDSADKKKIKVAQLARQGIIAR